MTDRPLTQEQVNALADGTRISVLWVGGNGPHEYVLHRVGLTQTPAAFMHHHDGSRANAGWLDMDCGVSPLTEVRLISE